MRKIILDIIRAIVMLMPVGVYALVQINASLWWTLGFVFVVLALTSCMAEDEQDQHRSVYPFWIAVLGVLVAGYNALRPTDGHYVYLTLCAMFVQIVMFSLIPSRKR